jgi:eukaryotic-like serine/threonine-protein kinase
VLSRRDEPPAAAPTRPAAAAPALGPTVFDPLLRAGEFQPHTDDTGACGFRSGLSVTTAPNTFTMCGPSPADVFPAGQSISVRARLGTDSSCAAIWFRLTGDLGLPSDGYQVAVCPAEVTLSRNVEGTDRVAAASRVTSVGAVHRVQLVADDRQVTVSIDGAAALRSPLTEAALVSGRVSLGAVARPGGRGAVTWTDAQLRSGTALDVPAVPAFTTGDARFTAAVWFLYDRGGVATVEPTEFLTGAAYCRRFALAATSPDCAKKIVPVSRSVRVTLPVDPDYRHLDYRDGTRRCRDPRTYIGTCEVSRSRFALMEKNSPWPAEVTIRRGVVTAVAKMDVPES